MVVAERERERLGNCASSSSSSSSSRANGDDDVVERALVGGPSLLLYTTTTCLTVFLSLSDRSLALSLRSKVGGGKLLAIKEEEEEEEGEKKRKRRGTNFFSVHVKEEEELESINAPLSPPTVRVSFSSSPLSICRAAEQGQSHPNFGRRKERY